MDKDNKSESIESSISAQNVAVSIGMPVYNASEYIRDALNSLLAQTFSDFEIIISDNASSDDTQKICEEYARIDSRINYVRQIENKGALANFKFVLDKANADLFMWAAYDDLWTPNYLLDATNSLNNKCLDFVFPTFELRSIRLGIGKKYDQKIFKFIELEDRRQRVLNFMAIHYLSLSVNIVYSLFRTDFLKTAWKKQDISNEGALGAVILSNGRGAMSNALFSKRYRLVWPGMLPSIFSIANGWIYKRNVKRIAKESIDAAKIKMINLFPEYEEEITFIFARYQPHSYDRLYRVCSIDKIL